VEYLVLDTNAELAEPAVESYLRRLQGERDGEAAALADAAKDAAQGGGGEDEWALDPTLLRRMAAVRDAERGLIVQVRPLGIEVWGATSLPAGGGGGAG
jgi:hypothetical protein